MCSCWWKGKSLKRWWVHWHLVHRSLQTSLFLKIKQRKERYNITSSTSGATTRRELFQDAEIFQNNVKHQCHIKEKKLENHDQMGKNPKETYRQPRKRWKMQNVFPLNLCCVHTIINPKHLETALGWNLKKSFLAYLKYKSTVHSFQSF